MATFTIHFSENGTLKSETVRDVSSKFEAMQIVQMNHPKGKNFH